MKRIFSVLLALMTLFSFSVTASAESASYGIVQPFYETAHEVSSKLEINGTSAYCESHMYGKTNVTKIVTEQTLQKQGFLWIWGGVKEASWSKTVYSSSVKVSNTKSGLANGKYRLKTVFTITDSNGKTETITIYSEKVTVG